MLQDIKPHVFHGEYAIKKPADKDIMILQKGNKILLIMEAEHSSERMKGMMGKTSSASYSLPTAAQIRTLCPESVREAFYLFSVDEQGYYSSPVVPEVPEDAAVSWQSVMVLRESENDHHAFGGAVGWQLASWYNLHRFCGQCGSRTVHGENERSIVCPECGHIYYPRISPVVIIAITDGDRILLTRCNRNGYRRHALVAGFVEVGETLEDAVRREVMEEVGLKVKNIRYIESQPWPFSSSLISGFSAEADGETTVHLNTDGGEELAEAVWVDRDELEIEDSSVSLTWDMIRKFRDKTL